MKFDKVFRNSLPRKPAFTHKPFAAASPWSSSSSLGVMRSPSEMTAEELGSASVAAAREQIESPKFWGLIAKRATDLQGSLEPRDIALILNGMSRTRQLSHHTELMQIVSPIIKKKLAYFSSSQMAMVTSALAKSFPPTSIPSDLIAALVKEIKSRIHEFSTAVELSMVLNALSKLGVVDTGLSQRLSAIIQSKIRSGSIAFHARELCVVASALSQMGVRDTALFELIQMRILPILGEATPVEISRLISAFAKAGIMTEPLLEATIGMSRDRFRLLSPTDLVTAIYGFGSVCEFVEPNCSLIELLNSLKRACITNLPQFQSREIAAVLVSFSRWNIDLSDSELGAVCNRVDELIARDRVSVPLDLVVIAGSLSGMCPDRSWLGSHSDLLMKSIREAECKTQSDWQSLNKLVDGLLKPDASRRDDILNSVSVCVVRNMDSLTDRISRSQLIETISGIDPDHDLVLVLRDS